MRLENMGWKQIANVGEAIMVLCAAATESHKEIPDNMKMLIRRTVPAALRDMKEHGKSIPISEDAAIDDIIIALGDMGNRVLKKQFNMELLAGGGNMGVALISYLFPKESVPAEDIKDLMDETNQKLLDYTVGYIKKNPPILTTNQQTLYDTLSEKDRADYVIKDMYHTVYLYWLEEGLRRFNEKGMERFNEKLI